MDYKLRARFISGFALVLLLPLEGLGQVGEIPAALPDAGISDEYLLKAGTGAISILLKRLEDPKNEQNYEGLLSRIQTNGGFGTSNPAVARALIVFARKHAKRKGNLGKTVFAICTALETVGMRGGKEEVTFLIESVKTDKFLKDVRAYRGAAKDPNETRAQLLECAIRGLGYSGQPEALDALLQTKEKPPKTLWGDSLKWTLDRSIGVNREVRKNGLNSVFSRKEDWDSQKKGDK